MGKRWMGVALVAAGLAVSAHAQGPQGLYLPSPVGAARMPEPIPCGPAASSPPPQPNLIPGPVTPDLAPMGPPDCLSLPADHTSAFQCENFVDETHCYFSAGMQWLDRQRLGDGQVAALSPDVHPLIQVVKTTVNVAATDIALVLNRPEFAALPALAREAVIRTVRIGSNEIDRLSKDPNLPSLVPATSRSPVLQQFNNVVLQMDPGVRGTIGYMWNNDSAIEYTSYYIFKDTRNATKDMPNRVDGLFFNPPAGFGPVGPILGDHGLWLDADKVRTSFGSTFWNNEVNFRRCNAGIEGVEMIVGMRYVQEQEDLAIFTGRNLPIFQATYGVHTQNNIVAPQFGGEYTFPVTRYWTFGVWGKGAWGANFIDGEVKLTRGDGVVGFDSTRAATNFAQIYDIGAFTDVHILERFRVRFGYNAVWLTGIAAAVDQVQYDLGGNQKALIAQILGTNSNLPTLIPNLAQRFVEIQALHQMELMKVRAEPHGRVNNNGSALFHGPMFELQFLF